MKFHIKFSRLSIFAKLFVLLLAVLLLANFAQAGWVDPDPYISGYDCNDPAGGACPAQDPNDCASCVPIWTAPPPYCTGTINDEGDCVGDPVLLGDGSFIETRTDFLVRLGNLAFAAKRSYTNKSGRGNEGLGHKWGHNFLDHIEENGNGSVELIQDGKATHIEKEGEQYITDSSYTLTKVNGKFILEQINGFKYYYDDIHNMVSHVSTYGPYYNWVYDGSGNVQTVQYNGTTDVFFVDWDITNSRITKITNALDSSTVEYQYSSASDLTRTMGVCGSCGGAKPTGYEYDANHNLTSLKDAYDSTLFTNMYDGSNRVSKQVFQESPEKVAVYDYSQYNDGIMSVTSPEGRTVEHYFDSSFNTTKRVIKVTGGTDIVTSRYYDENNTMTRLVLPGGREERALYDNQGRMTAVILYDATSNITRETYEYGDLNRVTRIVDGQGNVKTFDYSNAGYLLTKTIEMTGGNIVEYWEYNNNGQKTRHTNTEGVTTDYDYDTNGYLTRRVVDTGGLALETIYWVEGAGRVTKRQDPRGKTWETYYGSGNTVTKKVDPDSKTFTYQYDDNLRKTRQQIYVSGGSITRTTDYQYDTWGHLTRQTEPGSRVTEYGYDFMDRKTYMKTPTGEEYFYTYDEHNKVYEEKMYDSINSVTITRFTYDYDGEKRLTKQTNANGNAIVKNRQYDSYGFLTRQTDGLDNYIVYDNDKTGKVTRQYTCDSAGSVTVAETRFTYDQAGRVTRQRQLATPGGSTSTTADAVTDKLYDDLGHLTQKTTVLIGTDGSTTDKVVTYTYDNAGRMITQTANDGPTVAFVYDDSGNLLTQKVDPAGLALATIFAYDGVGRQTKATQPDSTYSAMFYDGFGQLTQTVAYTSGGTAVLASTNLYDYDLGLITKSYQITTPATSLAYSASDPATEYVYTAAGILTKTIDPESNATVYTYDDLGRQITITDAASNKIVNKYDNADRILTRLRLDYDGSSHITFTTTYEFDAKNRVTKTIFNSLAATIWFDAAGRVTQVQDAKGQKTADTYDGLGRVTRKTEDVDSIARYTDYVYDRASRLISQIGYKDGTSDAERTEYAYNKSGVQTLITYSDSGTVSFYVNATNRITRKTDQRGTNIDYDYDNMGRVLTKIAGSEYFIFTYNALGQPTSAKKGTSGDDDSVSETTFSYDGLGRLTSEAQEVIGVTAKNIDYIYDKNSQITSLTYPDGSTTIAMTRDSLNRLDVVSRSGSTLVDYAYVGRRVKDLIFETGANDVTGTLLYDNSARMTRLTWAHTSNTLPDLSYDYDNAGNILTKTHQHLASPDGEDYLYDDLYRLTNTVYGHRSGDPYHGFTYDELGNRMTYDNDGSSITYASNLVNEYTDIDGSTPEYDSAGNLTKDASAYEYFYDAENKLTRIEDSSNTVIASYKYDAFDRRIEIIDEVGSVTKRLYYDNQLRVLEEYDAAGTPARQKYYVWGSYVDELLLINDDSAGGDPDYFICHNHLYSPVAIIDNTGSIAERYDYDVYGSPTIYTDPNGDGDWWDSDEVTANDSAIGNPYFFTGRRLDVLDNESLNIMYYRARSYDPDIGRFLSRDPIGYIDGMNLYVYAQNAPTQIGDPYGLVCSDSAASAGF